MLAVECFIINNIPTKSAKCVGAFSGDDVYGHAEV